MICSHKSAKKLGLKRFGRVGRRHLADAEGGAKAEGRQRDQYHARPRLVSGKGLAQARADDGAADDGNERAQFEDAIAPGEFFLSQQFRQQAVF